MNDGRLSLSDTAKTPARQGSPRLLTAREVAGRLGIGVSTVHELALRGELESIKVLPGRNGPRRFDPRAVEAFVESRRRWTRRELEVRTRDV